MSLGDLQDQINTLLSRFWHSGLSTGPLDGQDWAPSLDVQELPEKYVIRAEVPGLGVEDIEVSYAGNTLTFKGEKLAEVEEEGSGKGCLCRERRFGGFSRNVTLPEPVDDANIAARCHNGVLEVVLPKREESRPKSIKIEVE